MLPDSDDFPPHHCQFDINFFIAFNIAINFFKPECASCFWDNKIIRAVMPKTAIYEYSNLLFHKNDIWFA